MVQQAFQVRRDQNIHAGRSGFVERAPGCVSTGGEEVGEDIVFVGSADQLAHGQAHLLGVIARQNVAEVAGGDAEIHCVAQRDLPRLEKLGVGGKIIDDLRDQTAPVDGVGAGQADVPLCQLGSNGRVAEDPLHAGLGVVKVAVHCIDGDIIALLRGHLQALDLAGAARGEEHGDLDAGDVVVTIQRGLAGIAAGRHQDQRLLSAAQILLGLHQELRHQLKGIVLECTGRAVPQLQRIDLVRHVGQIARLAVKCFAIGGLCRLCEELLRIIGQVLAHDGRSHFGVIECTNRCNVHFRKALRNKQTALVRQALCNGLRSIYHTVSVSRTEKLHCRRSFSSAGPQ